MKTLTHRRRAVNQNQAKKRKKAKDKTPEVSNDSALLHRPAIQRKCSTKYSVALQCLCDLNHGLLTAISILGESRQFLVSDVK